MTNAVRTTMSEQEKHDGGEDEVGANLVDARLLARQGRFAEATVRLDEAFSLGECTEVEALDLKARICAQQGLLLQAEACWRKAQSLDAENPVYADALTALRQGQRPFTIWRRTAALAGIAAVMLFLICTLASGHRRSQRLAAMEVMIGELRGPVGRTSEAITTVTAAVAKVTDADATSRQAVDYTKQAIADLRNEMDMSRNALALAINDRLKADAKRHHKTLEARMGVMDARQKARDEAVDAKPQKTQESLTALETVSAEEDRNRVQTNLVDLLLVPSPP